MGRIILSFKKCSSRFRRGLNKLKSKRSLRRNTLF